MKNRFVCTALSAVILWSAGGCTLGTIDTTEQPMYSEYFEYPLTSAENSVFSQRFAVDETGNVFAGSYKVKNTGYGQETVGSIVTEFDMNGSIISEYDLKKTVMGFDVNNSTLYGVFSDMQGAELDSVDLTTGKTEYICSLPDIMELLKLEATDEYIYILGKSVHRTGVEGEFDDHSGLNEYDYQKLIRVSLAGGQMEESKAKFPISFSVYDDKCEVYAADSDGYYFCSFDGSEQYPHEIQRMGGFAMIGDNRFVFSSDSGNDLRKLCVGNLSKTDGISQVYDNVFVLGNTIRNFGGYTYFCAQRTDGEYTTDCIIRLYNDSYIKRNNKIRFISAKYDFDVPFGCGYTMDYRNLSDEEFALTVLSQASDYDICIVNSYQSYSSNIRDKGSFYPLNDVTGVCEYLDKCFPCVKEAAMSSSGEIWMLPVSVNVPFILYNKAACDDAGIYFSDGMTLADFINLCEKAYNNGKVNGISAHPYPLIQNLLIQYLSVYNDFDTPVFREAAGLIKEKINISVPGKFPEYLPVINNALNSAAFIGSYDDVLFVTQYDIDTAIYEAERGVFNAVPLPDISGGGNTATCAFLAVNPASDNIDAALDYISSLSEYLTDKKNRFLIADRSTYSDTECMTDICGIYEKAHIGFNVSEKIIYYDLVRYMSGDITLEKLIEEGNRKIRIYMGE